MHAAKNRQGSPVIVAMDFPGLADALALADRLDPALCRLKVGKELFTRAGPAVVQAFQQRGFDVFLDLKFHDIPNTVAAAVSAAVDLGVWMVNVHALGGRRMLEAAVHACEGSSTWLTAVTILTSHCPEDLVEIGIPKSPVEAVLSLARLAMDAGVDGLVCSALEAPPLRQALGREPVLVTPGIRPAGTASDDQSRVVTPEEALRDGVDFLVIGRPITRAADPLQMLRTINADIAQR